MTTRPCLVAAVLLVGCSLQEPRRLTLVAAYNQTKEAGVPVVPQFGPQDQTGGLEYKGLCLYESNRYTHITHYWSYNTALAREDDVTTGDFLRTGADGVTFPGAFGTGRGRLQDDILDVDGGRYVFVKSQYVNCAASIRR